MMSSKASVYTVSVKVSPRVKCVTRSTEESGSETLARDGDDDELRENLKAEPNEKVGDVVRHEFSSGSTGSQRIVSPSDSLSLGIREPIYEVCSYSLLSFKYRE